eukprot:scaffold8674_cov85-Cylindrotheca_fusiformis.AAC.1
MELGIGSKHLDLVRAASMASDISIFVNRLVRTVFQSRYVALARCNSSDHGGLGGLATLRSAERRAWVINRSRQSAAGLLEMSWMSSVGDGRCSSRSKTLLDLR